MPHILVYWLSDVIVPRKYQCTSGLEQDQSKLPSSANSRRLPTQFAQDGGAVDNTM